MCVGEPDGISEVEQAQLQHLAPQFRAACGQLAACGIPETLEHGDMHAGNVAVTDRGIVFFDWTDGCFTHPFLCLAAFLEHVPGDRKAELERAYLSQWADFANEAQLQRALALSRPLGALFMAMSYRDIHAATEPRLRMELAGAVSFFLRQALSGQGGLIA
jgi:Ser/Thr protein kinase RdoA (MazF antagonist)